MEGTCSLCGKTPLQPHKDAPAYRDYRYPDVRRCEDCYRGRSPTSDMAMIMAAKELQQLVMQCKSGSTPEDLLDQLEEMARYMLEDAGQWLEQRPSESSSSSSSP
ncbi:hypothetical protein LCGC14_0557970 [marine sediment metagenome]|uniref:Uncharacterized protein n=1 Tax=marine sediment metagenome TaxID=412755 RepID=A0A0F9RT12_9ZZZZ